MSQDQQEDAELTRSIFGGTYEEIESVAIALAKVTGRHQEMLRLPRLTFSKTRSHRCDITDCLIPQNFPYLAFEDSHYGWSHVSLYGLYRALSFLCPSVERSPTFRALVDAGIPEDVLKKFASNTELNGRALPAPEYFL